MMGELIVAVVATTLFVTTFAPNVTLELIGVNVKLIGGLLTVRKLVDVDEVIEDGVIVTAVDSNVVLLGTLVLKLDDELVDVTAVVVAADFS